MDEAETPPAEGGRDRAGEKERKRKVWTVMVEEIKQKHG